MDYEELSFLEKIKHFFNGISVDIRHFFERIYSLITWFSVIWNDQQWDDHYFFIILRKKLERMESFQRSKYAHHLNTLDDAKNIHYCIERLDRIIENNYLDKSLRVFYERYPDYDWNLSNKFEDIGDGFLEYKNNDTPEQKELFSTCCEQADIDKQNDLDEIFAQLRLHIEEWWD